MQSYAQQDSAMATICLHVCLSRCGTVSKGLKIVKILSPSSSPSF